MNQIINNRYVKPVISQITETGPLTCENVEGKHQPTAIFRKDPHRLFEEMAQKHDRRRI